MKHDYFIASRYRNKDILLPLAQKIREHGKSVYCFIESDASIKHVGDLNANPEEAMGRFEAIADWHTDPAVRDIFEMDMENLRNAETVILVLPSGKSAHIEAGVAYGLGKKLVLIGEQKETESLYLIFDVFYATPDDFLKSLI